MIVTGGLAATALADDQAANTADNDIQTVDNSWQIMQCGSDDKDSDMCTKVSDDGNVRVHKWVTSTGTENEFDVHLSIDKRDDEISEVLNATAAFGNSNNGIDQITHTKVCTGQCSIPQTGKEEFYYQIVFTDEAGDEHKSEIVRVADLQQKVEAAFLKPGEIKNGDTVYVAWSGKQGIGSGAGTATDPAVLVVDTKYDGYDTVFGSVEKTISFGNTENPVPVIDTMGQYILYTDGSAKDVNTVAGGSNPSFDSNTNTLSWTPVEKTDVTADQYGWLNDVAELKYTVTLDVNNDGFISSGLPKIYPNESLDSSAIYDTNNSAILNYTVTTTETKNGSTSTSTSKGSVDFQQPKVRGLLYDLKAVKHDDQEQALQGAEFTLYDSQGNQVGQPVLSDENGVIKFTDLPWGEYTLTETKAPDGYEADGGASWTVTLCYTTSPDGLEDSDIDVDPTHDAMMSRTEPFVNKPSIIPVTVPGLTETKTIHGANAAEDAFTFTVTAADATSAEAAGFTGTNPRIEDHCTAAVAQEDGSYVYTCTNPAMDIVSGETSDTKTIHTGQQLVFDLASDVGTYEYTYTESTSAQGWHSVGESAWTVTVGVTLGTDGKTLQAAVSVFRGTGDEVPYATYTYTGDSGTPSVVDGEGKPVTAESNPQHLPMTPTVSFENAFVSVSNLPKTGGDMTARNIALTGGGVLLAACAVWLLARRRRV